MLDIWDYTSAAEKFENLFFQLEKCYIQYNDLELKSGSELNMWKTKERMFLNVSNYSNMIYDLKIIYKKNYRS